MLTKNFLERIGAVKMPEAVGVFGTRNFESPEGSHSWAASRENGSPIAIRLTA